MKRDLDGQVVVVTGASAGIGAALAVELSGRGARVVLAARRREPLLAVAALCAEAEVVVADVTRKAEVEGVMAAALARFGRVDAWVNNAGRGITRPVAELTEADLDEMVRDNLKSALWGMQAVLPHLRARGSGAIVNVSSMLARVPFVSTRAAYSAAKAALAALTDALRLELAQSHPAIRVVQVLPGVVATGFGLNALGGGPDSRALPGAQPVEEVARVVADAVRSGRGDVYTRAGMLKRAVEHLQALARD